MRKSTNFNLNLVEGNDLVNPLVQDVPNYETIDEQMYKNECNSIGIAVELKSGTVHALTRTIPNASMFRFQATSNFTAGDTFTVDGIQVSALTPSGETLASGCYIIGSEVLCVLRETLLTVYVSGGVTAQDSERLGGQLPEYYGTAESVASALETAQSANQLTLTLQQSVGIINNNLTLDYSNAKANVQDLNTFLQMTLDKLFPKNYVIYDNGVLSEPLTAIGVRSQSMYSAGKSQGSPSVTYNPSNISIACVPGYAGSVFTEKAIDLTNFSKLTVEFERTSGISFADMGFTTSKSDRFTPTSSVSIYTSNQAGATITLPIASLSGEQYLFITGDESTVIIKSIILE